MDLSDLDRRLLDEFQRDFPLEPRPYAVLSERLGTDEATVLDRLAALREQGVVSRVGAVFKPKSVGRSTLAALAVPEDEVERIATLVSTFPQVNHDYEREHDFNIWFVVTAPDEAAVGGVLEAIHRTTGYRPLVLPMIEDYHIDLGFPLWS
jgi:DNA-binding Lrp family transcriptional regulator